MPYRSNSELPDAVRKHLPPHAQDIFRETFNAAWTRYASESVRREEIAHRVAWTAVKKSYRKLGDHWIAK